MSKINELITPRGFEIVRDRIGEIVADEMANQFTLHSDSSINPTVFVERFIPFGKEELPVVNITLGRGLFDNKKAPGADGTYNFNIDVYANAKSSDSADADKTASLKMQRMAGMIYYILSDPQYRTLGFAPPSILSVGFVDFNILDPLKLERQDGLSTIFGRLNFEVKIVETQQLLTAQNIAGYDTTVKMAESDKGFFFQGNEY
jgi:hypothetical protein